MITLEFVDLPRTTRTASGCTPSTCTARTTTCPSRSWSRAPSPSTRPSAPARLHGPGHPHGGGRRAGRPGPGQVPGRGGHRALGRRRHGRRVLRASCSSGLAEELGFDIDTPWRRTPGQGPEGDPGGPQDAGARSATRNRLRPQALLHDRLRGRHALGRAAARRGRVSDSARERLAGYMREVPCPACDGTRLKPVILAVTLGGERTEGGRSIDEICRAAGRRVRAVPARADAERPRGADRRAGAQGGQRAAAVPGRRRPGLPVAGPRRPPPWPAARPSASGWPRRSARAWSACCTCSTSRPSACTSATTTG